MKSKVPYLGFHPIDKKESENLLDTSIKHLISCVVPVHNVEKYLSSCVDSILSQVYRSFEIILVDDGSTDDSSKMCDEYKLKNENIVVIHQSNGGLSDARNKGIQAAKGEFITFIDADDIVHPQFFELMLKILMEQQADICTTQLVCFSDVIEQQIFNQDDNVKNASEYFVLLSPVRAAEEMFLEKIDMSACGKLYKTELFKDIQFPKDKLFEDWATTYKVIFKARSIVSIPNRFYGYRIRMGSITQSSFHQNMMEILHICDEISDFLEKECPDCLKAFAYRRAKASMMLIERIIMSKPSDEHDDVLRRLKHTIRVELRSILLNNKVQILQKVKILTAAYSILLYRLAYKLYPVSLSLHESLGKLVSRVGSVDKVKENKTKGGMQS